MSQIIICIPTYNRPIQIRSLLDNLNDQTDTDFSTVILNDGANPETTTVLETFKSAFQLHHFESEKPSGLPRARNKILDFIKEHRLSGDATFVAFLDDDLVIDDKFISNIRNNTGKYDGFCFRIIQRGASTTYDITGSKFLQTVLTPLIGRILPWIGMFFGGFYIKQKEARMVDHMNGGCLIYNFSKNPDERFDLNLNEGNFVAEDTCFSYGLKKKGNRLAFIGSYSYIHNPPNTGGCKIEDRKESFYWYWKHKLYIFVKYHGKLGFVTCAGASFVESLALSVLFRTNLVGKYVRAVKTHAKALNHNVGS